eukprot:snap_masked-scaffold_12-processed-gene-3.43-mRNA-1 protein AED:0.47 eAED:0.50 QI:0/-1/0/1/-1/1/1/0/1217
MLFQDDLSNILRKLEESEGISQEISSEQEDNSGDEEDALKPLLSEEKTKEFKKVFTKDIFKEISIEDANLVKPANVFDKSFIEKVFYEVDVDESGLLDFEEFQNALSKVDIIMTKEKVKRFFLICDEDSSGLISLEEFVSAVFAQKRKIHLGNETDKEVSSSSKNVIMTPHDAFQYFDDDKSGSIDEAEFGNLLEHLDLKTTDAKMEKLFLRYSNEQNVLNEKEFCKVYLILTDPRKELEKRGIEFPKRISDKKLREMLEEEVAKEEALQKTKLGLVVSYKEFETERKELLKILKQLKVIAEKELSLALNLGGQTHIYGSVPQKSVCHYTAMRKSYYENHIRRLWARSKSSLSEDAHQFWGREVVEIHFGVSGMLVCHEGGKICEQGYILPKSTKSVRWKESGAMKLMKTVSVVFLELQKVLHTIDQKFYEHHRNYLDKNFQVMGDQTKCLQQISNYLGISLERNDAGRFKVSQDLYQRVENSLVLRRAYSLELTENTICFLWFLSKLEETWMSAREMVKIKELSLKLLTPGIPENNVNYDQMRIEFLLIYDKIYYKLHLTSLDQIFQIFLPRKSMEYLYFWCPQFKEAFDKWKLFVLSTHETESTMRLLKFKGAKEKSFTPKMISTGGHNIVGINDKNVANFYGKIFFEEKNSGEGHVFQYPVDILMQGIKNIELGYDHVALQHTATESNQISLFGKNNEFQLGKDLAQSSFLTIHTIRFPHVIRKISCGNKHSAALDIKGSLYIWGSNDGGPLGLGKYQLFNEAVKKPTLLPEFKESGLQDVSCGSSHTLLLTKEGNVFAAGSTAALGEYSPSFVTTEDIPKMKQISAGYDLSVTLSNDAEVFVFGSNLNGALGLPLETAFINFKRPRQLVNVFKKPINLALGKSAVQSSTYSNLEAEYAVNGMHLSESLDAQKFSHTQLDVNPFWEVDLAAVCEISSIKIFNRFEKPFDSSFPSTFYTSRLFPLWVFIHNLTATQVRNLQDQSIETWISLSNGYFHLKTPTGSQETIAPTFSPETRVTGSKVRIIVEKETYLHVIEVEVWGWEEKEKYPLSTLPHNVKAGNNVTVSISRRKGKGEHVEGEIREQFLRAVQADRENGFILGEYTMYGALFRSMFPWSLNNKCVLCQYEETCLKCEFFERLKKFERRRLSDKNLKMYPLSVLEHMLETIEFDEEVVRKMTLKLQEAIKKPDGALEKFGKTWSCGFKRLKQILPNRS